MTPDSSISYTQTPVPRRWWLWLAGLVLAFNAVTALPQLPRPDRAEQRIAALTAPVPVNVQFRDPAAAIKAAAQRGFKAQDRPDGDPPIPAHHAALQPRFLAPATHHFVPRAAATPSRHPAAPYRARAPPHPA